MSLQRLKHAYARGACIQYKDRDGAGGERWVTTENPGWEEYLYYRVHPMNAHLEYGPISSGCIEAAEHGRWGCGAHAAWCMLDDGWLSFDEGYQVLHLTHDELSTFMALFAEIFADMGV